jgi:hypothetical protein
MSAEHLRMWTCEACGDAVCEMTSEREDVMPTECPAGYDPRCEWVIA